MDFKIVPIPQPFFEQNNVIRIGDAILDTCHVDDASTKVLLAQLEEGDLKGVKTVIVTHPHIDHVGASAGLPEIGEMPHTVLRGAETVIATLGDYMLRAREEQKKLLAHRDEDLGKMIDITGNMYFPADRDYGAVNITRTVQEGDEIPAGDVVLRVVCTPGHEKNHMALLHEPSGIVFSGDLVTNNAQFNRAPLTPNIAEYERSLSRLLALGPNILVPSHGAVIDNAVEHLEKCLANVRDVKTRILEGLAKYPGTSHLELSRQVFDVTDPIKVVAVAVVTWCYLECLESEGKVVLDRDEQAASLR
jgi:glyoxylase-like metal-dependent hydrolase (beta-lactamase superfamily II)